MSAAAPDQSDQATLIATIPKNTREEVRVSLSVYRGHRLIDVRVYADGPDDERRATPKGVALKLDALPSLRQALADAEAEALRVGWIAA
jgi:hypothetical protein